VVTLAVMITQLLVCAETNVIAWIVLAVLTFFALFITLYANHFKPKEVFPPLEEMPMPMVETPFGEEKAPVMREIVEEVIPPIEEKTYETRPRAYIAPERLEPGEEEMPTRVTPRKPEVYIVPAEPRHERKALKKIRRELESLKSDVGKVDIQRQQNKNELDKFIDEMQSIKKDYTNVAKKAQAPVKSMSPSKKVKKVKSVRSKLAKRKKSGRK